MRLHYPDKFISTGQSVYSIKDISGEGWLTVLQVVFNNGDSKKVIGTHQAVNKMFTWKYYYTLELKIVE